MNTPKTPVTDTALFRQFTADEAGALAACALEKTYREGERIFGEHEEAYGICMLLSGRVGLQLEIGGGRLLTVGTVDHGEIFAFSGLVPPHSFATGARAVTDCEVAVFPADKLRTVFETNPSLGYHFMQHIAQLESQRLRDSYLQLVGLFGSS